MRKKDQAAPQQTVSHGCHDCSHWKRLPDEEQVPGEDILGECRRYPPQVVSDPETGPTTMFPLVLAKDACGERIPHTH